jgi:hypothetical protein
MFQRHLPQQHPIQAGKSSNLSDAIGQAHPMCAQDPEPIPEVPVLEGGQPVWDMQK